MVEDPETFAISCGSFVERAWYDGAAVGSADHPGERCMMQNTLPRREVASAYGHEYIVSESRASLEKVECYGNLSGGTNAI